MFAHLSPFVTSVIGLGFLGPLLILLFQGEKSPYVRYHAVEALNFQIAILIQALVMAITCIGLILLLPAVIFWLVVMIIAAVRANQGEWYRYPLIWRWVK
ncbi:hypothetical protein TH66_14280 [Carbonactinospora thermoautotrophica]|uniref:DUF4870 domain-containing protein n=1 Tax=Carbonactinospora thermoautotrophica TaxID=1469144 RepID=A0A132MS01_9ACTN|nr:hypothetical protein TH66_14280 [Carbonactinospora thermoautotrophica]KWX10256.1 hypothetical protein TR74_04710 [Carbonactinospora thermoautotrophica]